MLDFFTGSWGVIPPIMKFFHGSSMFEADSLHFEHMRLKIITVYMDLIRFHQAPLCIILIYDKTLNTFPSI